MPRDHHVRLRVEARSPLGRSIFNATKFISSATHKEDIPEEHLLFKSVMTFPAKDVFRSLK